MTLLRLSILKDVVIAAAQSGKVKTVLQAVALAGLILPLPHGDAHGGAFDFWPECWVRRSSTSRRSCWPAAVAMTMWSGYEFFRDVRRQRIRP